jgi:hypothetical protein
MAKKKLSRGKVTEIILRIEYPNEVSSGEVKYKSYSAKGLKKVLFEGLEIIIHQPTIEKMLKTEEHKEIAHSWEEEEAAARPTLAYLDTNTNLLKFGCGFNQGCT